ncbi:MAG: transglutaminase family protein [Gammaproteobacteria bacterium]|nr:transglutaminase family protein [Gammaproteobacteria bacterium]
MSEHDPTRRQPDDAAPIDDALAAHDAAVAGGGLQIWIGAEPTFTLRSAESPEWLSEPLGGDKQAYALRMLDALRRRHPGGVVLRSIGRQYAAEKRPRWSFGLYRRRDGKRLWSGPPDPLTRASGNADATRDDRFCTALTTLFEAHGWHCRCLTFDSAPGRRLLLSRTAELPIAGDDDRLSRPSVHDHKTPAGGLHDELAALGLYLFGIDRTAIGDGQAACIELPAIPDVDTFIDCLTAIQEAAATAGLKELVLRGFPPPVDARVAWTTITPDPAVIEVNQAPEPDAARFHAAIDEVYRVARDIGLSPYRLQYNGGVSDSGGGGQFTVGGPAPADSPFFVRPALLPRLVRYLNRHPALSYWFAPDYVGSASQSPRPDEGTRENFRELAVAFEQLAQQPSASPEQLWASLAPFLADPSGNAHRSELNIEKLCNPYLPGRGRLGLVEFRAFRMPISARHAAATAALLRALVALLADTDPVSGLRDWGDVLHDRYALPFYLRQDLNAVFDDLGRHGLGLDASVRTLLLQAPHQATWQTRFGGCELIIERAVEFWPLVGDVASQESGGSRTVDSSTIRIQVSLRRTEDTGPPLERWRLQAAGYEVPLHPEHDADGAIRLCGLRYRDFMPWRGLHPAIAPLDPLQLVLHHPQHDRALLATLHNWHPHGLPYSGLPVDWKDAAGRRAERLQTREVAAAQCPAGAVPPASAVDGLTLDLRRCPRRDA